MICGDQKLAPAYLAFLNERSGAGFTLDGKKFIARRDGGIIRAVVMYSRFGPRSCELTIASDGSREWATPGFFKEIFTYPFVQLGLVRCMAVVNAGNAPSVELCTRLGFVVEGHLREAFDDGDGVLMTMLRPECRWIQRKAP